MTNTTNLILSFLCTLLLIGDLCSQVSVFTESFNEASGSTSGSSDEGIGWSTQCDFCDAGVDYFAVENGTLENLDSNGPATFTSDPIDISACSSIMISLDYEFSQPWEGDGNMESLDEVASSCAGDPSNPASSGCNNWDILWVQMLIDNVDYASTLIGGAGTTDADQSGFIDLESCLFDDSEFVLSMTTQTWANDEWVQIDNIAIICYENDPIIEVDGEQGPIVLCANEDLTLTEVNVQPSKVDGMNGWEWNGPYGSSNGSNTYDLTNLQTTDSGTYTLTTTDANGCTATDDIEIQIDNCCNANAGSITIMKEE